MNLYLFCLALGLAGLGVMALGGVGHHGHGHDAGHGGHDLGGHGGHGHGGHGGHGHAAHGHDAHGAAPHGTAPHGVGALWTLAAPRVLFSVLLGFGAAGVLLRGALEGAALPIAALLLGIAFERLVVRRVMNALLGFASAPALTLESTLMDEARAASGFDANGEGLVAVDVDGQVVQVLGRLRSEDRALGVRVRSGDRLRIEDVDSARHRCTVSFLGRP